MPAITLWIRSGSRRHTGTGDTTSAHRTPHWRRVYSLRSLLKKNPISLGGTRCYVNETWESSGVFARSFYQIAIYHSSITSRSFPRTASSVELHRADMGTPWERRLV